jgi:hypothetical protein
MTMVKRMWQAVAGRRTKLALVEVPTRCGMVRYEWREVPR